MHKKTKDKHFIKKPVYKGGIKAMRAFISQALNYPDQALKAQVEGTVYLKYSIDYRGKVLDAKVISSLGYGCDEEAIRLVKLLTFKVAKIKKGKILFHKSLQIHFKLPKKAETKETSMQINYQYVEKAKKKDDDKGNSYSIRFG